MAAAKYGNRALTVTGMSRGCLRRAPMLLGEMPYADLHFHLLPGVDDGPADMDASLELARAAVAEGTGTVVATPHVRADLGLTDAVEIHARVLELRFRLDAAGIPLEIRCGGELGPRAGGPAAPERAGAARAGTVGRALGAGRDALPRHRRRLPRRHGRAARARLRSAGRSPGAQRRREPRRRRRAARRAGGRVARPAQRAVADRRPRRGGVHRGVGADRGGPGRRGGLGRARTDAAAGDEPGAADARRRRDLAPSDGRADRLDAAPPAGGWACRLARAVAA